MATTIEIHGSSNDTNLVLASDSASIADNNSPLVVPNVADSVLAGRMFSYPGDNLLFYFLSATQMVRLRIHPDISYSASDLTNKNWWLNDDNVITDFVYEFDSAVRDASQNVHLRGSSVSLTKISSESEVFTAFQWKNAIISSSSLRVPAGDMTYGTTTSTTATELPEITNTNTFVGLPNSTILNNSLKEVVLSSNLNYGLVENRLNMFNQRASIPDTSFVLTSRGKSTLINDPRTILVNDVSVSVYSALGSPDTGDILTYNQIKNSVLQLPLSLMANILGPDSLLVPYEFRDNIVSWPSNDLFEVAKREALALPDFSGQDFSAQDITFSDLVLVGYSTVGADPYNILRPISGGISIRQPNTASVAIGGYASVYINKHIRNFEIKLKTKYIKYHPSSIVLGYNLPNSGLFIGNKKIDFNDLNQNSPFFFNGQTVADPWGAWFDGTTYKPSNILLDQREFMGKEHYMIVQCINNQVRMWLSLDNDIALNVCTWDASLNKTYTIANKADGSTTTTDGAVGIQIEGCDLDVTNISIRPITVFNDESVRSF